MSHAKAACPGCAGPMDSRAEMCQTCRYPNARKGDDRSFPMNGRERAEHGCVCTFENADGRTFSIHRGGGPDAGLRKACEMAVALDPTFRLVSYSTPTTIWQDLQGNRKGGVRAVADDVTGSDRPVLLEAQMLGRIDMREMLHPRLLP